ncbi:MAG: lambda-exonuclease family protein, partial [Anaerolineaceae bacterium]
MSTICRLVQGSAEWHEHRRKYRNASETPIVMGVSPWQTPYQLWQQKLGLVQPEVNTAMLRGTELEPAARAAYEALTGLVMQPLVLLDGEYSASLDGLTLAGDRILEVKCPFKGRDSTLWKAVAEGQLPEHYRWQVQHQLMVTRAEVADVFVFDGQEGILLAVAPEASIWPRICAAWDEFARYVADAQAPPLTDRDTRLRDDPEWLEAAAKYVALRTAYDELGAKVDAAKERLVAQSSHAKEQGGGVTVTKHWKRGNVEYKRIPQLATMDL